MIEVPVCTSHHLQLSETSLIIPPFPSKLMIPQYAFPFISVSTPLQSCMGKCLMPPVVWRCLFGTGTSDTSVG